MDRYEKRRMALQSLVDSLGRGAIASIATAIGKDASYVSRMLYPEGKAGRKRIGEDTEAEITEKFPNWLSPLADTTKVVHLAHSHKDDSINIRQFETGGSMGTSGVVLRDQPGVIRSWRVSPDWLNKNVKNHTGAKNLVIVTGFGDSMRPMFNPGDPLLVDSGVNAVDFDAVYFFRVGDEGFIKRLQRIPGEGLRAISANKEYESWTIRPDMDFEVFGRVLKVWCSEEF